MILGSDRRDPHTGHRRVSGGLARAGVFGMSDGLTSNVLLVIGFAGSGVAADVVRLAGIAGAVAGAVSMGMGEWVSVSAQNELVGREVEVERRELAHNTLAEQDELAAMYETHGMRAATARQAAADVMRNPDGALTVHTREELGVDPTELPSPWRAAALSFVCFVVGAVLPVLPWLGGGRGERGHGATIASVAIGVVAAAALGGAIGRFADRNPIRPALRQVLILLVACVVTYSVGKALDVSVV